MYKNCPNPCNLSSLQSAKNCVSQQSTPDTLFVAYVPGQQLPVTSATSPSAFDRPLLEVLGALMTNDIEVLVL